MSRQAASLSSSISKRYASLVFQWGFFLSGYLFWVEDYECVRWIVFMIKMFLHEKQEAPQFYVPVGLFLLKIGARNA